MKKLLVVTGLVLSSMMSYGQGIQVKFPTLRYNGKLISVSTSERFTSSTFKFDKNLLSNDELVQMISMGFDVRLNNNTVTLRLSFEQFKKLPKFLKYTSEETFTIGDSFNPTRKEAIVNHNTISVEFI